MILPYAVRLFPELPRIFVFRPRLLVHFLLLLALVALLRDQASSLAALTALQRLVSF